MSWTEQRIQMLVELWGSGLSASEISRRLGGVTRNAVIGKVHRLKLSSRVSPINNRQPRQSMKSAGHRSVAAAPRQKMLRALPSVPSQQSQARAAGVIQRPSQMIDLDKVPPTALSPLQATERHCRWPVGDPRSPDFKYCGCTPSEGLPYCFDHARVAYQGFSRSRRRDDETYGSA